MPSKSISLKMIPFSEVISEISCLSTSKSENQRVSLFISPCNDPVPKSTANDLPNYEKWSELNKF